MSRPTTPSSSPPNTFTSPPRSTTVPIKPKHHIPHHPHRSHHLHRLDSSIPQSAVQGPTSHPFGELLSRTTSHRNDAAAGGGGAGAGMGTMTPPQQVQMDELLRERREEEKRKWAEVENLRSRRQDVESHLNRTLSALSQLSSTTTRRLDYTYYSLLSSVSTISNSLYQTHALSSSASSLHKVFTAEIIAVENEISSATSLYAETLDRQAQRVEGLNDRMKRSRSKVEELSGRLGKVRERVEGCQKEGEEVRRGRWGILGGFLVGLGLCIFLGWVLGGLEGSGKRRGNLEDRGMNKMEVDAGALSNGTAGGGWNSVNMEMMEDDIGNWTRATFQKSGIGEDDLKDRGESEETKTPSTESADATLKLFDQL